MCCHFWVGILQSVGIMKRHPMVINCLINQSIYSTIENVGHDYTSTLRYQWQLYIPRTRYLGKKTKHGFSNKSKYL